MAVKIFKDGNALVMEDDAQVDAYATEPSIRYSYYFSPPGSDNVIIWNDLKQTALWEGDIKVIVKDDDVATGTKADGKTYLNSIIG